MTNKGNIIVHTKLPEMAKAVNLLRTLEKPCP